MTARTQWHDMRAQYDTHAITDGSYTSYARLPYHTPQEAAQDFAQHYEGDDIVLELTRLRARARSRRVYKCRVANRTITEWDTTDIICVE